MLKGNNDSGINLMQSSDTLFLSVNDYKVLFSNENALDLEITNSQIASTIKNVKYSVIEIEFEKGKKIARGNDLFSSSVPQNCDYFYPLNKGYIVFTGNKINFRKVDGARN